MANVPYIVLLLALCCTLKEADALSCLTCNRAAYPRDCPDIASCQPHEECYLRQYDTPDLHTYFNVGCMDRDMCHAHHKRREVNVSAVERSNLEQDFLLCQECCDSDICNIGGCNQPGIPPRNQRGPICYNCDQQQTDQACNEIAVCGRDQACFLQLIYDVIYDHVYKSFCVPATLCQKIHAATAVGRKRSNPSQCCTDDLCNSGFHSGHAHTPHPVTTHPVMTTAAPVVTVTAPVHCPPITAQFRNSCYYFSTQVKYWSQAQTICVTRGGNLVKIEDQAENDFITGQLKQKRANGEIPSTIWGYYIGARLVNGHWVWTDSTGVTYSNWGPGEPDLPGAQPYGMIFLPGKYVGNYFWGSNANIDGVERYICEIKLP